MGLKRLWDRLTRLEQQRNASDERDSLTLLADGLESERKPESPVIARLRELLREQAKREGIKPGTRIGIQQVHGLLLRNPEASEIAHQIYERKYMEAEKGRPVYGLRELPKNPTAEIGNVADNQKAKESLR